MNRSKRGNDLYIRVEDSNYRSGTENAGLHQTLRGTILDKYSCFRIASMPPLLPLSHFIGTGYVKNLLAPTASASVPGDANNFVTRLAPNVLKILFAEVSPSPKILKIMLVSHRKIVKFVLNLTHFMCSKQSI